MLEQYKDVLTVSDLCDLLLVGKKLVYRLLQNGEIPSRKIGSVYRIRKDAVIDYLKKAG